MKPRRLQRQTEPRWQGKAVTAKDRTTSCVSSCARVKPFAGKVFYLDLPSNKTAETLESDIKQLGGTVEKFFSKDIRYLVSNKREARYVHCLRLDSPVPSPESGPSSPHLRSKLKQSGSLGDNVQSRSQGQTDTTVTSRGKSLVERVVKEQERVQLNKILSNALEWGVKILYIDDVIAYVHKKKKLVSSHGPATTSVKTIVKGAQAANQVSQKRKGGRLSKPFIKIEDSSRHYRPICLTMPNMPEFNLKTVPPCSPFCLDDKDPAVTKQGAHRGAKASASDERAHGRKKNRDKKRSGYCECCVIKYENLATHLQSERHRAFSRSDEYSVVDRLVSSLHSGFIHMTRPKCSVSSVLVSPLSCVKSDLRHMRNMTVAGCAGSYSGNASKMRLLTGSATLTYTEGDGEKRYPYSCASLAPEHPCTSRTEGQNPPLRTETPPPTGDRLGSFPLALTQVNPVDQISQMEINSSDSIPRNVDIQNDISSRSVYVMTNHQEESDMNKDLLLVETLVDGNEILEKSTENCLADREEDGFPIESFSPERKIRRKARVFKRRRPKVDAAVGQVKPNDVPDNSVLKLWELFQSSDDMNVEFHGFED
ncbi:protein DBF4 homolog A [Betta splendens]|uniref:Protein DBF4 homolog A n=1 Tax=Betta splendens TaxID=158456 RepID=A0A6P7KT28_BETSP|nr:protein DBF4 homolog A [Betta splendens]XP_028985653.1 protein DBF4 homolog A [Betta splendens]